MLIKSPPRWLLKESALDQQSPFADLDPTMGRRQFMGRVIGGGLGAAAVMAGGASFKPYSAKAATSQPVRTNPKFQDAGRPLTDKEDALSYCNFYEFGSQKTIADKAQALILDGWQLEIGGMVDSPFTMGLDEMGSISGASGLFPLEDRIYRHRCVEAWAMTVPWRGFPLRQLIAKAAPQAGAKYIVFETAMQPQAMPGLAASWYPWPYREAITLEEGLNDLSFLATGMYGETLAKQNGAPIRLVLPWKYGFKSIKSLVKISFEAQRPKSFWEEVSATEYGFWANVNPDVPHPRWSQARERLLTSRDYVDTQLFNGYGAEVAHIYKDIEPKIGEWLYR